MKSEDLFTNKVDTYVKYRPGYAPSMVDDLLAEGLLGPSLVIADVGAGSGLLTTQIIEHAKIIYAVEPNENMLAAATQALESTGKFIPVNATAEETTLADASIDVVSVGQAFHWFDPERFRIECLRILKEDGRVFMVWNRKVPGAMETERREIVNHFVPLTDSFGYSWDERIKGIEDFFGGAVSSREYDLPLTEDRDTFIGRTLSSSHAMEPDNPRFGDYLAAWNAFFDRYADEDGLVTTMNKTVLYFGRPRT